MLILVHHKDIGDNIFAARRGRLDTGIPPASLPLLEVFIYICVKVPHSRHTCDFLSKALVNDFPLHRWCIFRYVESHGGMVIKVRLK